MSKKLLLICYSCLKYKKAINIPIWPLLPVSNLRGLSPAVHLAIPNLKILYKLFQESSFLVLAKAVWTPKTMPCEDRQPS